MTKATETYTFLGALAAIWIALLLGIIPVSPIVRSEIVPLLPFWALVSFGAYALGTLGYDVLTFNDKPEKYRELMQQIETAKVDLKAKHVL